MEKLKIENFGGIKSMDFEFKAINLLIGPQGAGKSITVKLLYFFKIFFGEILRSIDSEETKRELDKKQKETFINFFPKDTWPKGNFKIVYTIDSTEIFIEKANNVLKFNYSDTLKKSITKARKISADEKKRMSLDPKSSTLSAKRKLNEKLKKYFSEEISYIAMYDQFFIPAGRSFFANIQKNIFSFLSDNRSLDPFLIEFGSFYENLKRMYKEVIADKPDKEFDEIISQILNSKFYREKDKDFLIHSDNRKVNLSNASSGQQETLPLVIILRVLNVLNFAGGGATIYIEEPEAHLFPIAQKRIVQILARTFNNHNSNFQIIVTTHSPYILSSFNNLLQAGRLNNLKPEEAFRISKVVPKDEQLNPDLLCAYSLYMGKRELLEDEDSKLISQTILDSVSNEIANEFGNLLDIEF
ncbi:MAG: ATP-binding protein [bacterium]